MQSARKRGIVDIMRLLILFLGYLYASNLCQEFLQACSPGSVRIVLGPSDSTTVGRVEYCYDLTHGYVWSTVCLQGWDINAGHVACRSRSSTWAAYTIVPGSDYVIPELDYVTQVSCTGLEDNLSQCNPTLVAVQNSSCNGRQTAGVICRSDASAHDIILVGGPSEREGFVQIYDGTSWGILTPSPGFWTQTQAQVACNQLGYSGGSIPVLATEITENTEGLIFNFLCPSNARALGDCYDNRTLFIYGPPATLSCSLNGQSDGSLRLVRSATSHNGGVLEVSYNGRYGTVCKSGFERDEAYVACRQLGFVAAENEPYSLENAFNSKPMWIRNIDCSSGGSNLYTDCSYSTPLGVSCRPFALVQCTYIYPNSYVAGIVLGALALVALCCSVFCLCVYSEEIKKATKNCCKRRARPQTREPAQTSQSTGNNRSPSSVSPGGSNPGPTVADEPPGQKQEHPANPGAPPPYEGVEKVV